MGTGNFLYKNRCIVVENDDLEYDNTPKLGDWVKNCSRNFPSRHLEEFEGKFNFWDVVLTHGYYEHACIDYVENEQYIDPYNTIGYNYSGVKEFRNQLYKEFKGLVKIKVINAIFSGYDRKVDDLSTFVSSKWDEFYRAAQEAERTLVEAELDKIKEGYGYIEISEAVRFSNGETIYTEV